MSQKRSLSARSASVGRPTVTSTINKLKLMTLKQIGTDGRACASAEHTESRINLSVISTSIPRSTPNPQTVPLVTCHDNCHIYHLDHFDLTISDVYGRHGDNTTPETIKLRFDMLSEFYKIGPSTPLTRKTIKAALQKLIDREYEMFCERTDRQNI
jgi:hypothetical protein